MNIYRLTTQMDGKDLDLLSIVNPEQDKGFILNDKCIIGYVKNNALPITPDNLIWNKQFLDHFHKTIIFFSRFSDQVIALAEKESGGFIYITDRRNPEQENPKPQDIIGSFAVSHGRIIEESYEPNPYYQLISEDGAFVLQPELEALLGSTAY